MGDDVKSHIVGDYVYTTKTIGKGSFSTVYKGFNTKTDEVVAIKHINKVGMKDALIKKLYDEVELLKQLQHPNIVSLLNFIDGENECYIVLEYTPYGDFKEYLKQQQRLEEKDAQHFTRQIAEGLKYLRSKNIVHRDLKPANILLCNNNTLKITDFNFARQMMDIDLTETAVGSPAYMAPEILRGYRYTTKCDLWSLGIIIYQMVYGHSPYHDAMNILDLKRKIDTRPVAYSNIASDTLNNLLRRLLRRTPQNRCDWDEFFRHEWVTDIESSTSSISSEDIDISGEIDLHIEKSQPIPINKRKSEGGRVLSQSHIIEDYNPYSTSYPHSHSVPINSTISPRPTPPPTTNSDFWEYMSTSVSIVKSALKNSIK